MTRLVLIDNERLKVMKVVENLEAAEYWTEILCRNTDTAIEDITRRKFMAKYTDMELRMMYYNATGKIIPPHTEYGDTIKLVYEEVITPMAEDVDLTPVSTLREILGRDLRHDPVVTVPAPDNSTTKVAQAPKQGASRPKGGGSGGSTGGPPKGGTTARVWEIANEIYGQKTGWEMKELRTAIIEKCIEEGINQSTAGTQYSKWKRHQNL